MSTWEVWSYDVLGNDNDGYEVNDRACLNRNFQVKGDYPTDKEIREALGLKRIKIDLDGDDKDVYVTWAKNGMPIGELLMIS